jgi:hypothetical protein
LLPGIYYFSAPQEFTSLEGRFRIVVPGELTEKVDSVETKVGKIAYHTFFLQTQEKDADNLFYMVSYCDYPEGIVFADSLGLVAEFFQSTMETAAESVNGKILYCTDIQLGNYPGKYWRIDYLDGKVVIKTKAYLAGNRFYSVQTISYQEKNINATGDQFFDSFRIL